MDMCEYEPLIDLGFSTPSVDQESPLTFGSLISCVTACLRRLHKVCTALYRVAYVQGCILHCIGLHTALDRVA